MYLPSSPLPSGIVVQHAYNNPQNTIAIQISSTSILENMSWPSCHLHTVAVRYHSYAAASSDAASERGTDTS